MGGRHQTGNSYTERRTSLHKSPDLEHPAEPPRLDGDKIDIQNLESSQAIQIRTNDIDCILKQIEQWETLTHQTWILPGHGFQIENFLSGLKFIEDTFRQSLKTDFGVNRSSNCSQQSCCAMSVQQHTCVDVATRIFAIIPFMIKYTDQKPTLATTNLVTADLTSADLTLTDWETNERMLKLLSGNRMLEKEAQLFRRDKDQSLQQISHLQQENCDLKRDMSHIQVEMDTLQQEIDRLRHVNADQRTELSNLQEDIDVLLKNGASDDSPDMLTNAIRCELSNCAKGTTIFNNTISRPASKLLENKNTAGSAKKTVSGFSQAIAANSSISHANDPLKHKGQLGTACQSWRSPLAGLGKLEYCNWNSLHCNAKSAAVVLWDAWGAMTPFASVVIFIICLKERHTWYEANGTTRRYMLNKVDRDPFYGLVSRSIMGYLTAGCWGYILVSQIYGLVILGYRNSVWISQTCVPLFSRVIMRIQRRYVRIISKQG